ncbi:hypothetical protein ERJ77_29130 [Vibrio anguillarum]|nr:hypothetical protein [Vibrio anguillarum]
MNYEREYTEASINDAIAAVCEEQQEKRELSCQVFNKGGYFHDHFDSNDSDSIQHLIHIKLVETDYSPQPKPTKA